MSRFSEIHQAYIDARKAFFAERDRCAAFAADLLDGLERYLGCPPAHLRFIPHGGLTSSVKTREAQATPTIDADGIWHCEAALEIGDTAVGAHKESARQTIHFELLLQPTAAGFNVGIRGTAERFSLPPLPASSATPRPPTDSPERTAFYEYLFQRMVESYRQPGQRFFETLADSKRRIGG
uniref:Uncharacterized protein n=1 Tax=candidate division WOR-3 bacterium TaxID=2052148 RepID=A0A7C4GHP5_UNCW3